MGTKLYVGNLSFNTTENELQELFSQAGTVQEVTLMQDKFTGVAALEEVINSESICQLASSQADCTG